MCTYFVNLVYAFASLGGKGREDFGVLGFEGKGIEDQKNGR